MISELLSGASVPKVRVYPNIYRGDCEHSIQCDSPIEAAFARVFFAGAAATWGITICSQYELGPYRYDFGFEVESRDGTHVGTILVECDGSEFHSSAEQMENDVKKNQFARDCGMSILRFRGTDIYNKPSLCLDALLSKAEELRGNA